jgi:hypothetical protein
MRGACTCVRGYLGCSLFKSGTPKRFRQSILSGLGVSRFTLMGCVTRGWASGIRCLRGRRLPRAGSSLISDVVWIWSVVHSFGSGPGHIGDISGPQLFICKVFMLGVKSFNLYVSRCNCLNLGLLG